MADVQRTITPFHQLAITDDSPSPRIEPFLKWPGGKRWLATKLVPFIKSRLKGRYYEPFLGGGAMFFALRPRIATLSDINKDLVNVYLHVRRHPHLLIKKLQSLQVNADTYYHIRASEPECPIEHAVRFLYLNRTAFSGMYRLNRQGKFNVPFGGGQRTPRPLWENNLLTDASKALYNRKIIAADFEDVLRSAKAGDVVYCDPTYTVAHKYNGFIRYNEKNFCWEDQERLFEAARTAHKRGVLVVVSNADHDSIRRLYRPLTPFVLERPSLISKNIQSRGTVTEFLYIFDPIGPDDSARSQHEQEPLTKSK